MRTVARSENRARYLAADVGDAFERERLYEDPSFAFVHMAMVGAWGRRAIRTS